MATRKSAVPANGVPASSGAVARGDYVTVNEAKEIVRSSESTLRRALGNGSLTRYKYGNKTLILLSELMSQVRKA